MKFFGVGGGVWTVENDRRCILDILKEVRKGKRFGLDYNFSFFTEVVPRELQKILKKQLSAEFFRYLKGNQVGGPPVDKPGWNVSRFVGRQVGFISRMKFSCGWRETFDPGKNEKGKFFKPSLERGYPGKWVDVEFLRYPKGRPCGYMGNLLWQSVSISLEGGFALYIVVPREWGGLPFVLDRVGQKGGLKSLKIQMEPIVMVDLFLPKFNIFWENKGFLRILREAGLGWEKVWLKGSGQRILVDAYQIKTGMRIDEKGINGFSHSLSFVPCASPRFEVVKVDRPFLFYLVVSGWVDDPVLAGAVFEP